MTHQLLTITNQTYITANEVCALLQNIAAAHQNQVITVILDNARYQRCAKVQDCARLLDIERLFLPPYSPNFNLIERLWGFVKDICLYSQYSSAFADFKQAIATCLSQTQTKHQPKLKTLLSLNFQTFKKVKS